MPPVRRYIRLTAHTTLLTLIFLDDWSDLSTWLLHPSHPALPRIVDALRDLILPKLREERDRERKGGSKKAKVIKDVVQGSDFEVSVFLRDGGTRHAVLAKQRIFQPKRERLRSNSVRLGVGTDAASPGDSSVPNLRMEDEDEENNAIALDMLPVQVIGEHGLQDSQESVPTQSNRRSGRSRVKIGSDGLEIERLDQARPSIDLNKESAANATKPRKAAQLVKQSQATSRLITIDSDSDRDHSSSPSPSKDDKKGFITKYDGFTIYGKVLYLVVKRLPANVDAQTQPHVNVATGKNVQGETAEGIMEQWMFMSQAVNNDAE